MSAARRYCPECDRMVLAQRPPAPHALHLVLTLLTCGLWLWVWLLHIIAASLSPYRCPACGRKTNLGLFGGPDRSARLRRQGQADRGRPAEVVRVADEPRPPAASGPSLGRRLTATTGRAAERVAALAGHGMGVLARSRAGRWADANRETAACVALVVGGVAMLSLLVARSRLTGR